MTDISLERQTPRRFELSRVISVLTHPRSFFEMLAGESKPTWLTPMLVLSVTALLVVIVAGFLKTRAAMMGEVQMPPDWQWWTPEMQENYTRAQQATQGPTFMYIFPLVRAWGGLWLGWILVGGLLHLGSTLLGGRGSMQGALNIAAWASLPFAIRDLLRVIYMLVEGHAINSPGLSGFAMSAGFIPQLLARIDLFVIWYILLLVIGFGVGDGLSRGKAVMVVVVIMLLILAAQAGIATLTSGGGQAVQRPFF
jgi:hypothetical protein